MDLTKIKLKKRGRAIYAPVLDNPGKFYQGSLDTQTGLPQTTSQDRGNARFYQRAQEGVTRWYIGKSLHEKFHDDLTESPNNGRLIILEKV